MSTPPYGPVCVCVQNNGYTSTANCVSTILKTEGVQGFYKGITPNALKIMPNNAIRFLAFDLLRGYFGVEAKIK